MPLITETYYLSLTQDNRGILRLRCSQDDTLRTVNLKLYNNGSIFAIPSGVSASISGVKQNGTVFSKSCTISQDRKSVVLQLSSDITNTDGIIVAEIVLNDGEGGRLGTSNFIIQIEKNPIRAGVVQDTETPIEYINDFIEKIQTLTARLNNLITPSGDASLAEVVDARIGVLDSTTYQTTYQTLGARLNAEFQRLKNALRGVTILESTGDTTDRTSEILSKLNAYGTCKLGKGDFYVNSLIMPEGSQLVGSGKSTRVVLLGSETNTYVVKPKSGCIIEDISFYGGFTGTYSELIASSDARRHCIILDKFNDINSEDVILNNISINNFVGSAIVQRATNGCHCKDVVINMCYAGIDISNTSYDGQCVNVCINDTKFGVIQNGSNFVFSNCISKDSSQHIMSDQQNTECIFSSCTFFDSSLETTSTLAILSNARNGFVFDSCMFDSSLKIGLIACDGIVIKGTNFVGSDTFKIIVQNGRNTLLLITDCIADVEPTVTNAGTAARITSCYLKDGTAWTISEADITVDDELSDESENPVQNKVINRAIGEIKADLNDLKSDLETLGDNSLTGSGTLGNTNYEYKIIKGQTYNLTVSLSSELGTFSIRTKDDAASASFIETLYTGTSVTNKKIKATENANVITIITNYDFEFSINIVSADYVLETVSEEINNKEEKVNNILYSDKNCYIATINNKSLATNQGVGRTVDITNTSDNSQARYGIFDVKAGDKFTITGHGGNTPRLWCFTDTNYKILSVSGISVTADNLELTASKDGYLIVNFIGILAPAAENYKLVKHLAIDNIKTMGTDLYQYSGIDMFTTIATLGDSFTQGGMRNSDNTAWVTSKKTYPQVLGARHGITVTNYGRGGSTTKTYITDEYGLPAVLSATRKSLYIMSWGLNDAHKGMTLGSVSDIHDSDYTQNPDTFYGNYGKIISQLLAAFPLSRFVIFGPWLVGGIYSAYNDAAKKIAEHFSIGYCNPADDPFFTSAFYNNSLWGNHPIQPSYSGMAYAIERLLSREIVENYNYYKYTDIEPYTP